jgi:hypothetical protein
MEVIEMRMRQEHEINRREISQFEAGAPQAFQEEQPVGEVGIDKDVEVRELDEERGMADPRDRNLARVEWGKDRFLRCARSARQKRLPHHLMKKGSRIEVIARRQIAE